MFLGVAVASFIGPVPQEPIVALEPPPLAVQAEVLPYIEPVIDIPLSDLSVSELIRHFSDIYGASSTLALNVACAESQLSPLAKNPHSTASGVFQFIKDTHKRHCTGDVFDKVQNVECGVRLIAEGGISHWNASKYEGTGGGWSRRPYERGLCAL